MLSATEEVLISRYSQVANSQTPKGIKDCIAIQLSAQYSQEKEEFLVHYLDNKLYFRCLYDDAHAKQLINQKVIVSTPLASKDYRIEFHTQFIDEVRIVGVYMSPGSTNEVLFVHLTNEVDFELYRIPLSSFKYQINGQSEVLAFEFAQKKSELHFLTRNIDVYEHISIIRPLTENYLIGFDRKAAQLCLLNYADSQQQIQRFRHENQHFHRLLDPTQILVDTRGLQLVRSTSAVSGVLQGKSGVILIYQQYCAVELWDYCMNKQGSLSLRESPQSELIVSKFSYLKSIYPQWLIPQGFNNEHSFNIVNAQQLNYRASKSRDEQFMFVVAVRFRGERNPHYKAVAERQMDQSMIANVPDEVFIENNIFLYSSKRFLCAANVDFNPDIISISQCQKYIFAASTHRNVVASFRIDQEKSGYIMSTCKTLFYPDSGARLTQVISTPKWICMIDALDEVYCYSSQHENDAVIALYCAEEYGVLHLPKDYSIANTQQNLITTTDLNKSLTKSVHFDDELSRRKVMTRIPNLQNFINTSLFSPRAENYLRSYSRSQFAPKMLQTFDEIASSVLPNDAQLSRQQVREVEEKFTEYYNIYEKMRVLEEFLVLCIDVSTPDERFQHLSPDIIQYVRENADNIRISQGNANFDFGSTEFLYNEIEYINPKLIDLLSAVRLECAIDFSMIDSIKTFFNTKSLPTRYLDHARMLLDMQLGQIDVTEAQICEIIEQEISAVEPAGSLDCLLSNKIAAMMEYLRLCALHEEGGFAAIQQAISSEHSSLPNESQETGLDFTLDINDIGIDSPQQLSEKVAEYAKRTENVLKASEKALLAGEDVIRLLPDALNEDTGQASFREADASRRQPQHDDFDFAQIQNIESVEELQNPIISQKNQKFIRQTLQDGETVDGVQQQMYIVTDNDKKSRADEIRIVEMQVRDEDAPDDGNYVIEKIEEEYYEETISGESDDNVDPEGLDLNEAEKQINQFDIELLERQIPTSASPEKIQVVSDPDIIRLPAVPTDSEQMKVESLDEQAVPNLQQSDLHSLVSEPDEKYSEETKRLILNYVRMELQKNDSLRSEIEGKSKLTENSAIERLVQGIQRYSLIKKLDLDEKERREVIRMVLRLPPPESRSVKDKVLNASKIHSSFTDEKLDSTAFLMESEGKQPSITDEPVQEQDEIGKSEGKAPEGEVDTHDGKAVEETPSEPGEDKFSRASEDPTNRENAVHETAIANEKRDVASVLPVESEEIAMKVTQEKEDLKPKPNAFEAVALASNLPPVSTYHEGNEFCSTVEGNQVMTNEVERPDGSMDAAEYTAFEGTAADSEDNSLENLEAAVDDGLPSPSPLQQQEEEPLEQAQYEEARDNDINNQLNVPQSQETEESNNEPELTPQREEAAQEQDDHHIAAEELHKQTSSDKLERPNENPTREQSDDILDAVETVDNNLDFTPLDVPENDKNEEVDNGLLDSPADVSPIDDQEAALGAENGSNQEHLTQVATEPHFDEGPLPLEASRTTYRDPFYQYNQSQLLSPGFGQKLPYLSPTCNSLASQMLNTTDAQMFDCEIDREALLRDLDDKQNLEHLVDGIIHLQRGANRFFETAFIHQKRQNGFREHIMQIREGRIPRNEVIANAVNQRTTLEK